MTGFGCGGLYLYGLGVRLICLIYMPKMVREEVTGKGKKDALVLVGGGSLRILSQLSSLGFPIFV